MEYRGRVAIVTGASSGIGKQIAIDFGKRGAHVVMLARRGDRLAETLDLVRSTSPESMMVVGDMGKLETVKGMIDEAERRYGRIDILVNNAGVSKRKHILRITPAEVEEVMRINFLGPAYAILGVLPIMQRQGEGYIVNISSVAGKMGNPKESVYCASKFALGGFSEALWYDLHRRGIHVAVINPGPIDTEIWSKDEEPPAYKGRLYPPSVVSRAVFRCIERRKVEMTVPRAYGLVLLLRALFPGLIRRGTDRFDPDRPDGTAKSP